MEKIKKILLLDDSNAINNKNERMLGDTGYFGEIVKFNNSIEALTFLSNNENDENFTLPEVIFLDINMPEVNGFEFLERYIELKEVEKSDYEPLIVVVSDYLDFENFTKSKNYKTYGVLDHIKKPMDLEDIENLIEEHFEGK